MANFKHRMIVFLTGILICLILLEVSLRIVGSIYADLSESDEGKKANASNTILCIGDSVTFGIGAPSDLSYPAQLQKMLNESGSESKYSVINRGWPGQNSAQFLLRLEKYLQEFKPDIVTILIGAQNQVNYFGYQDYLQKSNNQERGFLLSLHDSLDTVRIYKFFRLLFRTSQDNWIGEEYPDEQKPARILNPDEMEKHKVPECIMGLHYKENGDYDKALEVILGAAQSKEIDAECSNVVGSIYSERQQFDKAVTWFNKGIEQDPTQFRNYEGIAQSYYFKNQLKEAISWFKKGFEQARYDSLHPRCYTGIGSAFEEAHDIDGALEFFEKETRRKPLVDDYLHTLAGDYLSLFKKSSINKEVHNWIEADIEKMLDLCDQYNATPILQNYPFMPPIAYIYRRVAERRKIPFVDHQTTFQEFTKDGVLSRDYFVPDGHPNSKGYQLMAKNIWMVIRDKD